MTAPDSSAFDHSAFDPDTFSGRVRLFPIPNVVMFPHVLCPLHVFEPRYRELTQAALAGDHLIAIPTLKSDAPTGDVPNDAPLDPIACLGRVTSHHRSPDGRYTLLLQGVGRIRLAAELETERAFREAKATLLEDQYPGGASADVACRNLRDQLLAGFRDSLPVATAGNDMLVELAHSSVPLGMIADIAAFAFLIDQSIKKQLLAELDVVRRTERLIEQMPGAGHRTHRVRTRKFPPDFGLN
jgi:Lon protease-like protein